MEEKKIVLGISDKPKPTQWLLLSIQHLFAMFGATVLVPALTGLSPAVALVSSGVATLIFIVVTRGGTFLSRIVVCIYRPYYNG